MGHCFDRHCLRSCMQQHRRRPADSTRPRASAHVHVHRSNRAPAYRRRPRAALGLGGQRPSAVRRPRVAKVTGSASIARFVRKLGEPTECTPAPPAVILTGTVACFAGWLTTTRSAARARERTAQIQSDLRSVFRSYEDVTMNGKKKPRKLTLEAGACLYRAPTAPHGSVLTALPPNRTRRPRWSIADARCQGRWPASFGIGAFC
jgi:hypothetical protein